MPPPTPPCAASLGRSVVGQLEVGRVFAELCFIRQERACALLCTQDDAHPTERSFESCSGSLWIFKGATVERDFVSELFGRSMTRVPSSDQWAPSSYGNFAGIFLRILDSAPTGVISRCCPRGWVSQIAVGECLRAVVEAEIAVGEKSDSTVRPMPGCELYAAPRTGAADPPANRMGAWDPMIAEM